MGKSIDDYKRKRDFKSTPEPKPGRLKKRTKELSFVVHRHEARRLHYDLRLEMDGVLKSWAVPRGFSFLPEDKHLAVRTEDHPLEYYEFSGVIPKGQYGAGTMTIWDRGKFEVLFGKDGVKAIEDGKIEIVLRGRKLRGEWHMVRTAGDKDEWLLFKGRDSYARNEDEAVFAFDYRDAERKGFPRASKPMSAKTKVKPFSDDKWWFEMKFAGIRASVRKKGEDVRLATVDGDDFTGLVPEVTRDLQKIRATNAVLDGVLVALDELERPSKVAMQEALQESPVSRVQFYAFDVLYAEEFDLRKLALRRRKEILRSTIPALPKVLFVDYVEGAGENLHAVVKEAGLGGVIAKKADSSYSAGPSTSWREVPCKASSKKHKVAVSEALEKTNERASDLGFKISNPRKVFWPEEGYTKGDMIEHYELVSEYILPYLRDRPLHLNRFPDGIYGKSFYQKDAPAHVPDWIQIEEIRSDSKDDSIRFIVCNDRATLLYLANMGSIDLHPWSSRLGSLDSPDWAMIDLDPKEAPFDHVMRLARTTGKVLRGIGLRPYLKTSGSTGLHIYVPLVEGYSYEQARMFCEAVARYVVREHPDIATVERAIGSRSGKVYIDFGQNRKGQTIVPPYVLRPVPGAKVSTPLDWDELSTRLDPLDHNIRSTPERLRRLGDLFKPTLTDKQDLMPAIEAMMELMAKG